MDIENIKLEGDAKDIAEQIFQQLVGKVYEDIKAKDPAKASEFAFCMAGQALAQMFTKIDIKQLDSVLAQLRHFVIIDQGH